MIGALGEIPFIVTQDVIRTVSDFKRSGASRWASHDVHLRKPVREFLGPGIDTISFTMRFDVRYGMNPRIELAKLVEYDRSGKVVPLIIGNGGLGVYMWTVTSVEQDWQYFDENGNCLVATANVTLEEYTTYDV